MMHMRILGYLAAGIGILFSIWYVAVIGIVLLVIARAWLAALLAAFLFDLLYGAFPMIPALYPSTIGTTLVILFWEFLGKRLRSTHVY